ncbi:hypothetical protein Btru_016922 [Bulinus truncatus]|nr:hypothetical protein Btru_016922 [Bulinus truncatus]
MCENYSTSITAKNEKLDNIDEIFEPHLLKIVSQPSIEQLQKRPSRPLFAAAELGIREKLLIVVLSSEKSVNTLGVALNKTVGHYQAKVFFFVEKKASTLPSGMILVNFNDGYQQFLPLNILKYVTKEFGLRFDYYLFISDKGYIRAEKIYDFVSHISVTEEIYLGSPIVKDGKSLLCNLEGGIIISQSVLSQVNDSFKWCIENCNSSDQSVNFGRCLYQATKKNCQETHGRKVYTSYHVKNFNFNNDIRSLKSKQEFNNSLTVFPIPDNITYYKLHRYFCEVELNFIKRQIQNMADDIFNMSQFAAGGRDSLSWPIGLPEPHKPTKKFDVINWVYFTETHIFFQDEFTNVKELFGIDKLDIQNIIKTAVDKLNERYNNKYLYSHLINGYRRFDPMRGMEYILDLSLIEKNESQHNKNNNFITIEKRLFLVKPLGEVEFVPMPHVEELTRINIILTLSPRDLDSCISFLENYAHLQIPPVKNLLSLTIVLVYEHQSKAKGEGVYSVLKSMLPQYNNKSTNGDTVKLISFVSNNTYVADFKILDMVSELLEPDALILRCTVGMLLNAELLNRVCINTIPGWQVFFPIVFWQFKPNIIYDKKPYPTEIEFSSRTGHYDVLSYEHGSFYNSDYIDARKSLSIEDLMKCDLYEIFVRYGKVNVFRAVEPEFKHYYMQLDCPVNSPSSLYERCLERKSLNLATRAQLAQRIFQYQAKKQTTMNTTQKKTKS